MNYRFYLFRHGETNWNREGRFQGHADRPLNSLGRSQAKSLIPVLEPQSLQVVLSSDLIRAQETGSIVAEALNIPIKSDPRLREAHLGVAEGLTRDEIVAKLGEDYLQKWKSTHESHIDIAYPEGESGAEVMRRAFDALEHFVEENLQYENVGVATHGGVIRRIMQRLIGANRRVPIPNGIVYLVEYEKKSRRWGFANQIYINSPR